MKFILFAGAATLAAYVAMSNGASAKDPAVFLTFGQCDQSWECSADRRVPDKESERRKQDLAACLGKASGSNAAVRSGKPPADQIWLDVTSNEESGYSDARFAYQGGKWGWRYRRTDGKLPFAGAGFCQALSANLRSVMAAIVGKDTPTMAATPGLVMADISPDASVLARCGPLLDHFEPVVSTGPDDLRLGMTVEEALRTGFLGTAVEQQEKDSVVRDNVNRAQSGRLTEIAVTKAYLGYRSARVSAFFECGKLMSIDMLLKPDGGNDWPRLSKLIKSRYRGTLPTRSEIAEMTARKRNCVATLSEDHSVNLIWRRSSGKEATWLRFGDPRLPEHAAAGCAAQLGARQPMD